jgi:hypothetical protein
MKWKEDGKAKTSTGSTKKKKDATGSTRTKEVPSTQGNVFSGQIPDMDASK